jgi:phosphoribosylformylglycinamidine (FGAM) synthase-like amidotransferase family enzyme
MPACASSPKTITSASGAPTPSSPKAIPRVRSSAWCSDEDTLDRLEGEGLVAFRYCAADGTQANPNGSARAIAGIYSPDRRILGLMPHPEDHVDPLMGGEDGAPMFQGLVEALAA